MQACSPSSIAFLGNYVPRRCGIATFTRDLRDAVAATLPSAWCPVAAMSDGRESYGYPAEVRIECRDDDLDAYVQTADFLNTSNIDVVSLQHEYGIFGGEAGAHILTLLQNLRAPVLTTLHTVSARPSPAERRVMDEIIHLSGRLVVMAERGRSLLREVYGVAEDRIEVIPHGIPDMEFIDPAFHKDRFGLEGCDVLLTFGLLSPSKGIEHAITAMPQIVQRHPGARYVVLGATHPHLVREQGEAYRESLVRLADAMGVSDHVIFHDRYTDMPELLSFLGAADIYLTPYLNEDQITSGTLAYAFGCGKAVLSTPYWHAQELLAHGRGVLVPFRDADAIAAEVCDLLEDDARRHAMRKRGYMLGREMTWPCVADRYVEAIRKTRRGMTVKPRRTATSRIATLPRNGLPPILLDHVVRLTDATGILQHASYDIPNRGEGYCTDDNARALALMVQLESLELDSPRTGQLATTYASFVGHAFNPATGRFRNFLGFDRRWLDDDGSDDCLGRAIVALGNCIGRSQRTSLQRWAMPLFGPAIDAVMECASPRSWGLAIIGMQRYLERFRGDRHVLGLLKTLLSRLVDKVAATAGPGWIWFEEIVSYENARPCQALVAGGRTAGRMDAADAGLAMLDWLATIQRAPNGRFSPVGCRGFLRRGGEPAVFDQQPIEAQVTVAACIEAFHATLEPSWLDRAWNAFDWFQGQNVLGIAVGDPRTGGCRDGLLEDRANENQGAESTLAYIAAIADMTQLTRDLQSVRASRKRAAPCR